MVRHSSLVVLTLIASLVVAAAPVGAAAPPTRAFCDVDDGRFYSTAVEWAKAVGITSGVSPTEFDPNGATTRGQIFTMLHR